MPFATLGDVTLHYQQAGPPGGPVLAFVNSLGTNLHLWDEVALAFAARFNVLRHDKRGHGLSDCPPGPYSIGDHSSDLIGLLDHLGMEEVIVVGISIGGLIALDFALEHPQRVRAMVICDSAAKVGTAEYWAERRDAVLTQGLEPLTEMILGIWFGPDFKQRQPATYRGFGNMLVRTPATGYAGSSDALGAADLSEAVKRIQTPTLVLSGEHDGSAEAARALADSLVDARFELIAEAGHLPCVEQPEAVIEKINDFLAEQGYD